MGASEAVIGPKGPADPGFDDVPHVIKETRQQSADKMDAILNPVVSKWLPQRY
jgi:hypothetical protein